MAPIIRQGTVEEKATVDLEAGKAYKIHVEYTNTMPASGGKRDLSQPALMRGVVRLHRSCPASDYY